MAQAVVMQVKLGEGGAEEGLKMLKEMVVPQAKAQPGFQHGTWMNADGNGLGVIVFDTAENAQAASTTLRPPPGGPELVSCIVYDVGAEA